MFAEVPIGVARPFFTVVVCTWNRGHLLPRAFESLLRQTEQSIEVIVVDDASTDTTDTVLQNYSQHLPSMTVIHNSVRRGTAAARNAGVAASTGLFITFLDSDDEYTADHLSIRRALLEQRGDVDLLHGGVEVVGDPFVIDMYNPSRKIHVNQCVVGGTFCIRREVFATVGMFNEDLAYGDDTEFFERVEAAGLCVARCEHNTYVYYRNVVGQLTSSFTPRNDSPLT